MTDGLEGKIMRVIQWYRTWSRTDEDVYDLDTDTGEVSCEPDEIDQEEGKTATDLAADYLADRLYVTEASSSPFQPGAWYSRFDEPDQLAPAGATHEETSAHLKGFTPQEEARVYELLRERRALIC